MYFMICFTIQLICDAALSVRFTQKQAAGFPYFDVAKPIYGHKTAACGVVSCCFKLLSA